MIKKELKIVKNIIKIISIIFSIFFTIILLNIIFFNKTIKVGYKTHLMIILPLITYFIIYILHKKTNNKELKKINKKTSIILIIIGIAIFIMQIIIAKLTYGNNGWDCGIILYNARALLQGKPFNTVYFSQYPNNIGILLVEKYILIIAKLFNEITESYAFFVMIIFNIIMVDIAGIFTFLTCKKVLGIKKAYFSLIFILPLIALSPYIIIPYTDTITMVFPIIMLYVYIEIKENASNSTKRNLLIFIESMLLVIGTLIKPTVIILMIAIVIIEILNLKKHTTSANIKNGIIVVILIILGCSLPYGGYSYLKDKTVGSLITEEEYNKNSIPFTHFLMMGMQEQKEESEVKGKNNIFYGTYSSDDKNATKSVIGHKEKKKFNMQVVKQRLNNFGFLGYLKFLYNKANWILSDGTFFYGCEGKWIYKYYNESDIAKHAQQFINIDSDKYQNITANIMQTAWILVIVGLIFSKNKKDDNNYINISKFAIIGIVLFIMLFEGRSRYLINYIPIFILVGTYGLDNLNKIIDLYKKIN